MRLFYGVLVTVRFQRMASSGMLRLVAVVRTDVSEECISSIISSLGISSQRASVASYS
jgi:hypothetical protein